MLTETTMEEEPEEVIWVPDNYVATPRYLFHTSLDIHNVRGKNPDVEVHLHGSVK